MRGFVVVLGSGMNVLAAPFLYVMPSEIEAYACFTSFLETCCPTYVQPTLSGVHRGVKVRDMPVWGLAPTDLRLPERQLFDKCLKALDIDLYNHLKSKNLGPELYAFSRE
jgi:cell cycle arrest protein BUB2